MKNTSPVIVSIVEDKEEIGQGLQLFLNKETQYCCDVHYTNGKTALEGIVSCQPKVVIMDIGLPDMTGVDCMSEILKKSPQIQFIMFTVFDSDELLFSALQRGASGYILKDDDYSDVKNAIDEVLLGGGPMSPSIAKKVIQSFNAPIKSNSLEILTEHQKDILKLVSEGLLNKEIASKLNVVEGTIKNQIRTIYKKLQVNNRVEASTLYRKS